MQKYLMARNEDNYLGDVFVLLVIIGLIVYFFQALYQVMVPFSVIFFILAFLALILNVLTSSEDWNVVVGLFVLGVICAVLAYISYQIGYVFGGTTVGRTSTTFFDLYVNMTKGQLIPV
jgi:hypothetical protein